MKTAIILILAVLCAAGVSAQGKSFIISYPIGFPMGNLHDYTTSVSFRGISMEFGKKVAPKAMTSVEVGWNVFYQHVAEKAYTDGTATITGVQYRYTNSVPILAGLKYYPAMSSKTAGVYVGLGVGTLYTNRSTDFGLYRITNEAWQFCIRPEAGIEYKMKGGMAAFVGAKYYAAFNSSDLDGQPFLSANVGFKFSSF